MWSFAAGHLPQAFETLLIRAAAGAAAATQYTVLDIHFASADFHPGEKFRDTNGELIQAHGGGMLYHEGVFYWYGENKDGPTYTAFSLRCLSSSSSHARIKLTAFPCHGWLEPDCPHTICEQSLMQHL